MFCGIGKCIKTQENMQGICFLSIQVSVFYSELALVLRGCVNNRRACLKTNNLRRFFVNDLCLICLKCHLSFSSPNIWFMTVLRYTSTVFKISISIFLPYIKWIIISLINLISFFKAQEQMFAFCFPCLCLAHFLSRGAINISSDWLNPVLAIC